MIRALLIVLLLATPAHAVKSIAFVGDSIHQGGHYDTHAGEYRISRHNQADTLRKLLTKAPAGNQWKDATVVNWTIPSSNPSDWTGSPNGTLCTNYRTKYPHLEAACRDSAPILNYIPSGYDLVLVTFSGSTSPSASAWVDTLVTLTTALDAVNTTILTGASAWGPSSGTTSMPADSLRTPRIAVEAEMSGRGIINGAHDTTGLAPMNYDTLHFHDQGYAGQAGLWYSVLP